MILADQEMYMNEIGNAKQKEVLSMYLGKGL